MEQLKRWADYECMCAFCPPASLSASEFQGAGRQKPRFSQSCARAERLCDETTQKQEGQSLVSLHSRVIAETLPT
jgi:hypothetical protein